MNLESSIVDHYNYYRLAKARQYVLATLIEYTQDSPLADEPEVHANDYSGGKFSAEDLQEALLDVRQFLESTRMNLL